MKALKISHLCLVGALMLGLMVAWSAASPQQLLSSDIVGGCWECTSCSSQPCNEYDPACGGGGRTCFGNDSTIDNDCSWGSFDCTGAPSCSSYQSCTGC